MSDMENMNWFAWGTLVMKWARDTASRPSGVAQLNQQMQRANVGVSFSETQFTKVAFAQAPDDKTVQIFLPTVRTLDKALEQLRAGEEYKLPTFYGDLAFGGRTASVKQEDKEKLLASRIGDYAIGQCA